MALHERYRPGRNLEHGPLGDVFLAEDLHTGETVVIRALERHFQIDPTAIDAVRHDSAVLADLGLPTVAPYRDIFYADGSLHLVTDYLRGPTLEAYIQENGPLDPHTFTDWAISLTRTLIEVHVEGVLHGDLRPTSIFVVPKVLPPEETEELPGTGELTDPDINAAQRRTTQPVLPEEPHPADPPGDVRLVIGDFGLYRLLEGTRLSTTTARQSLSNFTSPQRWQGQPTQIDDDIWSLGILFFFMGSGKKPFDGPSDAAIMQRVLYTATPNLRGKVPRGIVSIIERCLEKDPWRRYRSLPAILSDLERGNVRWPGRRPGLMPHERNPWRSWGLFVLLIILMLGIPAGGGAAVVARFQPTATPLEIAGIVIPPTPTPTQTPVIMPFLPEEGAFIGALTPSPTWTPQIITNTPTLTLTPSFTPTITPTPSITPSRTPTASPTPSPTASEMPSPTTTQTYTPQPPPTASDTPTELPPPSATPTTSPTASATFTPTATPTATPNLTATTNYEAFLTRAAHIQGTQVALETRAAPTEPPDLTATTVALAAAAETLAAAQPGRTTDSALALCPAGEMLVAYNRFAPDEVIDGLPRGFTIERLARDPALHLGASVAWPVPITTTYSHLRFDLLAPETTTAPLTLTLVTSDPEAAGTGWRLAWRIDPDPQRTGLVLEQLTDSVPTGSSPVVPVPFDEWISVDVSLEAASSTRDALTLTVYTANDTRTARIAASGTLPAFDTLVLTASIDSAPWVDNVLLCNRLAPAPNTP